MKKILTDHYGKFSFGQNSGLTKWRFLSYRVNRHKQLNFIIFGNKLLFCVIIQDSQGPQPKFKDFPGPGIFFR